MVLDWQTQGASRFIPFSLSQFLIPSFKSTPAIYYNWSAKKSKHNNNRKGNQVQIEFSAIRKTQRQKRPRRHFCKSTSTKKDTETTHKQTHVYTWDTKTKAKGIHERHKDKDKRYTWETKTKGIHKRHKDKDKKNTRNTKR